MKLSYATILFLLVTASISRANAEGFWSCRDKNTGITSYTYNPAPSESVECEVFSQSSGGYYRAGAQSDSKRSSSGRNDRRPPADSIYMKAIRPAMSKEGHQRWAKQAIKDMKERPRNRIVEAHRAKSN